MRLRRVLGAGLLVAATSVPGALGATSAHGAPVPQDLQCQSTGTAGKPLTTTPWPTTTLNLDALSVINQGQYVSSGRYEGMPYTAGEGVPVAVIDSGLIATTATTPPGANPVFAGADIAPLKQIRKWSLRDCVGHGTEVTSLIVGQRSGSRLEGVAPKVHLYPFQYIGAEATHSSTTLVQALTDALALHVRVINLSLQMPNKPDQALMSVLSAARREGVVIVAAGGNDGQGQGPYYPAALSPTFDNIIAVSAVAENGTVANFGVGGSYIDVAAPGQAVPVAVRGGGFTTAPGTSYAVPFVTGTVAVLLATHPDMTPAEVRNRLEATAVPPPGTQPNSRYGWGTIDPVQAVTSVRNDSLPTLAPRPGRPLAAPRPEAALNRSLEHRALAIALVLLGLAALTVTGAAIVRGGRRTHTRRDRARHDLLPHDEQSPTRAVRGHPQQRTPAPRSLSGPRR